MKERKVTVIIAAYNAEKYLKETLESIVSQTIDDYEICVVNDGSTDHTRDILSEYENKYEYFHVIDKENGGPSSARNAALSVAQGEYIYFMDADDRVELNALECLYERAREKKADMVIARYDIFNQYGTTPVHDLDELVCMEDIDRYDERILWTFSLWNKLFRRSVIEEAGLLFPPVSYSEDGVFTMQYVYHCHKITGLDAVILHYRRMTDGENAAITATISEDKICDYIEAHRLIADAAEKSILSDHVQYRTVEEAKRQDPAIHKYLQTISRKEFRILLNHFYGKYWSLTDKEIHLLVREMKAKLEELDMRDISLLADMHPEYSFARLYENPADVTEHAFCCYVLYGEKDDADEFIRVLQSVTAQNLIGMQIYVPVHMEQIIRNAGIWQGNIFAREVMAENELFHCALEETTAAYITFGDRKIAYANNAFKYAMKRFIKSEADFLIELIYHRNYGDLQAVLLNNLALNSQKSGYEWNEFLCMDRTLANKFFRVEFVRDLIGGEDLISADRLDELYRRGYYAFYNDGIVFYEDTEESFLDFVATDETRPFMEEYLRDKDADLDSPEVLADPGEVLPKLMMFPAKKWTQVLFRKIISVLRRCKVKDQVLFFSIRKNGELEGNAKALYPFVKGKKIIRAKLLPHHSLQELRMYHAVITSKVIVTDDYNRYLRYFPLRKNQRVVQLWHACGAFKKFGRRGTNLSAYTDSATHAQYNIVSVSGNYIRSIYADAFNIDPNKVKALGCPRTDEFFDTERIQATKEAVYAAHPELKDRYVVIYAPTFRDVNNNRREFHPELDFDRLSGELPKNQMFVICPHPIMQNDIVDKKYDNICVIRDFSTNDLMLVSDLLVTDYSSVIFEYALLKKPIAFFCYDLATYDRGFYLNYPDDLPGNIYEDQEALTDYLIHTDRHVLTEKYHTFADRYMSACDGHSCERIAKLINDYMEKEENRDDE